MDRYRTLVSSFYKTHRVIVEDKNDMLEDLTNPERRKQLAFQLEKEASSSATPIFKDIPIDPESFIPYPYSPSPEPIHDPTMDTRYAVPQGSEDGSDSELPIENSDGWRRGSYEGSHEYQMSIDGSARNVGQSSWMGARINPSNSSRNSMSIDTQDEE